MCTPGHAQIRLSTCSMATANHRHLPGCGVFCQVMRGYVCAVQGHMPALLSHYRPDSPIYAFTENRDIQRRLALYHGITALYMDFTQEAEETFEK